MQRGIYSTVLSLQILPLVNGSSLVQSELLANFSLVPGGAMDAGGFSLGAVLGMNNGTEVTIYLNGSYSGSYVTQVPHPPFLFQCLRICRESPLLCQESMEKVQPSAVVKCISAPTGRGSFFQTDQMRGTLVFRLNSGGYIFLAMRYKRWTGYSGEHPGRCFVPTFTLYFAWNPNYSLIPCVEGDPKLAGPCCHSRLIYTQ